jgi:quercetin dioxygenase-like cupin family protein
VTDIGGVVQPATSSDAIQIRLRGEDSGGELSVVEMAMAAGADGPPLHLHPTHGEGFYVLVGELTFQVGDTIVDAGPGTWVFAPRNAPHTLANHGREDARVLCVFAPAGFERRFERMIGAPGSHEPSEAERATRMLGPPIHGPAGETGQGSARAAVPAPRLCRRQRGGAGDG